MNSPNPAYYEAMAAACGVRPTPARSWSIPLTSANHGVVGPLGHPFKHAGEHHERVVVVEVPGAAGAPSDEVNLVLRAEPADFARAIEHDVAAQAGQVAVPDDVLRVVRRLLDGSQPQDVPGALMVIDSALMGTSSWTYDIAPPPGFLEYVQANYNGDVNFHDPAWHAKRLWNAAMRNAKPPFVATTSAPAVAQQAPAPGQAEIEWSHDVQERLIAAGDVESDEVRGLMAEAASLLAALTGRPAPSPAKESK